MTRIFISYRRGDSAGFAGRLHDRLVERYGAASIFRDVDSIPYGADYLSVINTTVRECDAFVAVIGRRWLTAADATGQRRLDDPDDLLRNELIAALKLNLRVIPVLVDGAAMPGGDELPRPLARLTRHNAISLSDERWEFDVGRLLARLEVADDRGTLDIEGYDSVTVLSATSLWTRYRALPTGGHGCVTVKVLHIREPSEEAARRFHDDCRAISTVSWHPNLLSVRGWGLTASLRPYIVSDDIDGSSLEDRLAHGPPLAWQEVVGIGTRLATALEAAHGLGVLHRDIKPSNVLVGPRGEPLLDDFGVTRLHDDTPAVTAGLRASVAQAAPEVLSSADGYSVRSDVYSLGSTLHTLMAGSPPFTREADHGVFAAVARTLTDPVPDLRPHGVPAGVCEVIERAMDKDPARRWPSAGAFGEALAGFRPAPAADPPVPDSRLADEPPPP
ncbi:MAG: protein kinase, partial [Acidimicrobiales bacterium]